MVSNTREDQDMLVDLLRHFVSTCLYTSVATVSRGLGTPNYTHVHTVRIGSSSMNQEMARREAILDDNPPSLGTEVGLQLPHNAQFHRWLHAKTH